MKVLVTGGTGFIGSHTTVALRAAGHDVRLLIRSEEKLRRTYEPHGIEISDFVIGDVADRKCVDDALKGCDGVVHAAAVVALEAKRSGDARDANFPGVSNVVGGAAAYGLRRIVYVSSVAALFRPSGPPIRPDDEVAQPTSAYGASKARAEMLVRQLQADGAPIATTYPTGVIGPTDPGLSEANRGFVTFLEQFMPRTSTGCHYVDVRDVAAAHAALIDAEADGGRYIVGGHYMSWRDVRLLVEKLTGRSLFSVPIPGPALRQIGWLLDQVKRLAPIDTIVTHEAATYATQWPGVDSSQTTRELGIEFRDVETSFAETLAWLAAAGHVASRSIGNLVDRMAIKRA